MRSQIACAQMVQADSSSASVVATVLAFSPSPIITEVIRGIVQQTVRPRAVILLDNGSSPGQTAALPTSMLDQAGMKYEVLDARGNIGVGAGHNRLVEAALRHDPEWVWMLEHDSICDPDCLRDLLEAAQELGANCGAVVPNLARNDEERELAETHARRNRETGGSIARRFTFNAVLLSRRAIEATGPFREDLFVGGEDWDYSDRLHRTGWHIQQRLRPTGLHPTRGNVRHGVHPSPSRQYYSVRSAILRSNGKLHRLTMAARLLPGAVRDPQRGDGARRIAARVTGVVDGLRGRGGEASYWFMR